MYALNKNLILLHRRGYKKLSRSLSVVSQASKYKEGDKLLGYTINEVQEVPELNLVAIRLQHEKTGADHLHIARDDKNNVFSVAFRTTPKNNTGVPHILEHITLAGSQRYPCRDPFFKMLNRSLATFMNAFTGSDYTMYPFSTQNSKDFENLLRVYLDAVFYPCLRERDFRQEGWRLEHEDINDKSTPIILKGVVFNEMKGVFSDPNQHFMQHLQNKIFPSNAYSFVSGGDPLQIPHLTWEELKQFHSEYYHPSNSRFYTYGNFPLELHLSLIEDYALQRFSKISTETDVLEENKWHNPKEFSIYCRQDPMAAIPEKQTTVSVSYLLNKITETHDSFAMTILSNLLIDGPNSPFYRALLEPGIGSDYSPATGYEGQTKQSFFSVGLREIHHNDVQKVKDIIEETFDNTIKNGFPKERIEGAIHNIELATKHQTSNFGLNVIMSINALWNHGGNPINGLKVNEYVHWFWQQMETNPHFLQEKIHQYFKGNSHKLTLVMTPSQSFENEIQKRETELLEIKLSALTEEEKQSIYQEGIELCKFQQKAEDVSCLPTLHINDVQKVIEKTHFENITLGGVPLQLCEQPTNGIIYFKALSTVDELPENLQMLLPLFSNILTKMGAGDRNYKQLDQEAELTTNGLNAAIHVSEDIENSKVFENGILLTSHCLEKNLSRMLNLWKDIFNRLHLEDHERLSQLIKMTASDLAQGIVYEGHIYTMRKASSCLSACSNLREHMSGLSQVSYMKKLAEMNNYEEVIKNLRTLATIILRKDSLRCSLNATSSAMHQALNGAEDFLSSLPGQSSINSAKCQGSEFKAARKQVHFVLPYAVNYVGKSIPTVPYTHQDYASLKTATKLLSSKYLHREIREKGGAYGGGAALSLGGDFMFFSYRDPNVTQTLQSFLCGTEWLLKGEYTVQDIDEAKLGIFGEVDQPVAPGVKGLSQFLNNITDNKRQQFREGLFSVTKEDIISVTNRYLIEPKLCGMSLIGPENDITSNNLEWIVHME